MGRVKDLLFSDGVRDLMESAPYYHTEESFVHDNMQHISACPSIFETLGIEHVEHVRQLSDVDTQRVRCFLGWVYGNALSLAEYDE